VIPREKGDDRPGPKSVSGKSPGQRVGAKVKLVIGERPELVDKADGLLVPPGRDTGRAGDRPKLPEDQE
jgi:hypothetical protein